MMRKIVLFVPMIVICCAGAAGQKPTASDPLALATFGFKEKRDKRTLINPAEGPLGARECGAGVYVKEETVPVNDRLKKVRVVFIYFQPNPSTLAAFSELPKEIKARPVPGPAPSDMPAGVSSLTFFWPPRSWPPQETLLIRAEKVDGRVTEVVMSFFAAYAVQEGDSPSILWTDATAQTIEFVGRSDTVLFKLSLPRGAKKCIEGK